MYRTHVSTSAKLRLVIRKGSQRRCNDLGVELCKSGPRRPNSSARSFLGLPNALRLSCFHPRASIIHLPSSPSSTWQRLVTTNFNYDAAGGIIG